MALIRWYDRPESARPDPAMQQLRQEMNRLLSSFWGGTPDVFRVGVFPAVNVSEDQGNLIVRAELPGMKPEDIDISVEGETLTLRGERKLTEAGESVGYHRRERESGRFRRTLTLPAKIDPEGVNATFKNGVLKVLLPKAKEAQPKQIQVKTE